MVLLAKKAQVALEVGNRALQNRVITRFELALQGSPRVHNRFMSWLITRHIYFFPRGQVDTPRRAAVLAHLHIQRQDRPQGTELFHEQAVGVVARGLILWPVFRVRKCSERLAAVA